MRSTAFMIEKDAIFKRKAPSLLHLCKQTTIDNLRYLGDVGETDIELLKDILPHCTEDQLMHIEKSTHPRDLSAATDKVWLKFFQKKFGMETYNVIVGRMKQHRVVFPWRKIYETQVKQEEEDLKEQLEVLRQKYKENNLKKQSRQLQVCTKIPPSSKKRDYGGCSSYNKFSSTSSAKGGLMKKARMEFLNSHEVKMHTVMRRNAALQRSHSAPRPVRPTNLASSCKTTKPVRRP